MRIAESALQMASVKREESRAELSFATRTREQQLICHIATDRSARKTYGGPPQGSGALPSAALLRAFLASTLPL